MQQNPVKQKYKEFSVWLASYYKIANLNLDAGLMTITFYFPDKRRRDFDNLMLTPKLINDGLVEAGVFKDDSGDILRLKFENFQYDKLNSRVEILIEY
jgi:Holliday junction resolvase RusA-like endonuclease